MNKPIHRLAISSGTVFLLLFALLGVITFSKIIMGHQAQAATVDHPVLSPAEVPESFLSLLGGSPQGVSATIDAIDKSWDNAMLPMALEVLRFSNNPAVTDSLLELLRKHTGKPYGFDLDVWFRWLWSQPEQQHPHYAQFKSALYQNLDPKFANYFDDTRQRTVRLDEIRWGGVRQDGIPPLRNPEMIDASQADYLNDTDVVFGIAIGGDTRAYPKRILAWHEMFIDTIGGVDYAGVYCTLCGAVILYETTFEGVKHFMGTSGFLYRSNKVMYDKETQSLWSTTRGEPMVGPLVGKGIRLQRSFVVTSTWGEWKRRHPDTTVLSLQTGYQRDYGEGVAYNNYFSTDELMFAVPKTDNRLANKDEVLALWFPELSDETSAISAEFLTTRPVYHHKVGPQRLVVLTDASGANRVYDATGLDIVSYDGDVMAHDAAGIDWRLSEAGLHGTNGETRKRLPAHRAFWFGWHATFDDTNLIQ